MTTKFLALSLLLVSVFALAAAPAPIDEGKTTANVFESSFFHFRYEFPKGWFTLEDKVRLAENKKRQDEVQQAAEDRNNKKSADDRAREAWGIAPYSLLVASRTAVTSSEQRPLPRVVIQATERSASMAKAEDPSTMYIKLARPKVLRGPEETVIAGHKFVRADMQLKPDSFLSKFVTENGDYLLEFDLRANNQKEMEELANTMQSLKFSDH